MRERVRNREKERQKERERKTEREREREIKKERKREREKERKREREKERKKERERKREKERERARERIIIENVCFGLHIMTNYLRKRRKVVIMKQRKINAFVSRGIVEATKGRSKIGHVV